MTTRRKYDDKEVVFYCTVTCYDWIRLFEITNFYDAVYKWFDILKATNNQVNGYVIMPNHLHALIRVDKDSTEINKLVANGKRFMTYEIVKRLEHQNKNELLKQLEKAVSFVEQQKGKLHEIFEPSFDCKPCYTKKFLEQKLDYIHHNPCSGKWNLANEFTAYKHSSARFYELDEVCEYKVDDYRLFEW